MEDNAAPELMLQAEKALPHVVHPHLLSYCPTMDLVAVVTQEEQLEVYRLNGQRAFSLKRKDVGNKVDAICWKFNGQHIAVAWHDGSIDIVSSETGKIVKQIRPQPSVNKDDGSSPRISCLAWGVNFIDTEAVRSRVGAGKVPSDRSQRENVFETIETWTSSQDELGLDDFLDRMPDLRKLGITPDLPKQLALIDPQDVLPKLPVIPPPPALGIQMMSKAASTDAFGSQQSIDAIFHSNHLRDQNAVDALLLGYDDGTIVPTIYDTLEIGGLRLPAEWPLDKQRTVLHASHPYSCSHLSLIDIQDPHKRRRLALVPLTLRFIPSAGIYLHLIASKTAQLQNLLQYVRSSLKSIIAFFKHSQDLPGRFMRNVNETLAEKEEGTLVENLFHLAVTGDCPETIREWLVDELTESGHKRWEHAAIQGYSKVVDLTHENLLPALDRCSIVISRLRGLARYHDTSLILNVPANELTAVLNVIQCLRLLAHNILTYAAEEKRQFAAFSKWLRYEIDLQATDPSSNAAEEMADKDPGIDYEKLLAYIPGALSRSMLLPFLEKQVEIANPPTRVEVADTIKSMNLHKQGKAVTEDSLSVLAVSENLQAQCQDISKQITAWQAANSAMSCGLVLEDIDTTEMRDMRIIDENLDEESDLATYVALVPADSANQIRLHRIIQSDIVDSIESCVRRVQSVVMELPDGEIKDVKFVDNNALMLLFRTAEASYIISIPYAADNHSGPIASLYRSNDDTPLPAAAQLPSGGCTPIEARPTWRLAKSEDVRPYVRHVFPVSERFTPVKIDVNGRKDRRVVCVLGDDLKHYKVYDLDYEDEGAEGDMTFTTVQGGGEDTVMSDY